jgi:Chitobiase/beta-hexosaminidase C-terminal domain
MRLIASGFVVLLSALTASAQHAATMAAQQAAMANQQAMQATEQANQQAAMAAQQANQIAMQNAQAAAQEPICRNVAKPRFSVEQGTYPSSITLRMKDSTRGAVIYYTTDGWTPTPLSIRYAGPVNLSSTTTLQAIAVTPRNERSPVVSAAYTITGSVDQPISTTFPASAPGHSVLTPGARLPLVFTAPVTSASLQVGDPLPIALAQDISAGGVLLAGKSTPVFATVTHVDKSGRNGLPGTLTFEAHSLKLNDGTTLLLSGTETKEGQSRVRAAGNASIIPLGGLFVRGREAQIPAGASLTAFVRSTAGDQAGTQARVQNRIDTADSAPKRQ